MTSFVLIPGAGGAAWYWHRVLPELRARGHEAVAVDLPAADPAAGLAEYTDTVVAAVGDRTDVVLVAQSMGGLTAPLVARRVPTRMVVMLNAMTPRPGESGGEWWEVTGQAAAVEECARKGGWGTDDFLELLFHDVPAPVRAEAMAGDAPDQSDTPFAAPWPGPDPVFAPGLPVRFLQGRDDRFFPLEFQRRLARDRLGVELDEMPGGHLVALSRPVELADRLVAYLT
ncbi:alpha/beta fold hydrolase [Pseudonocardia humida]|uniref:Alpha/beta hydrolase n=1 Tax=Pseudonocardia humida TaxID=2800819 RepID=A0ABT0ZWT5_9PSEU|nr:alpha/beta fold hydrolase [Pseudonocardia humida]MCO1655198.1 alpha/beta hydrolase [Pseudonocardia humida]